MLNPADISQFSQLLNPGQRVLILVPANAPLDSMAAGLALSHFLAKQRLMSTVVGDATHLPTLSWLPTDSLVPNVIETTPLTIHIDHHQSPVVTNDDHGTQIRIPNIQPNHVRVTPAAVDIDLIVTIGINTGLQLQSCGATAVALCQQKPVVSISNLVTPTTFAQTSLHNPKALSLCQIVADFAQHMNWPMDAAVATILLGGIFGATNGLMTPRVTPELLDTTAWLMEHGADHGTIVSTLLYNHSLTTVQRWGNILQTLDTAANGQIVWAHTSANHTSIAAWHQICKEICDTFVHQLPDAHYFVLCVHNGPDLTVITHSCQAHLSALDLLANWHPTGTASTASCYCHNQNADDIIAQLARTIGAII